MYKAGIAGYNALRAVFSSLVRRLMMLGIMAFMDQKDSGSVIYYAGFAGDNAPRAVFRPMMLDIMAVMDQKDSYGDVGKDCALALLGLVLVFTAA